MNDTRSRFYEEFTVGQTYPTTSRLITLEDHLAFCKLVRYEVPLFLDPKVGEQAGLGGLICPSHLIMSFSTAMTGALFSDSILGLVSLDRARFLAPVRPGDTLRTEVEVVGKRLTSNPAKGIVTFRDHVFNQHDHLVFQNDKTALIKCAGSPAGEVRPVDDILRRPIEVIEQVQSDKLRAMLGLCARGHPYYMRKWKDAGIDIAGIRSVADLEQLALTPKQDMMKAPDMFRLDLPDLPLQERVLWEIIYTTGTSADPTPVYNTTHDYHAYLFQSARLAEISGIRETDVIANLFPLTPAPMGAFVRSATNAYAAGATIFAALPGAPVGAFKVQRSLEHAVRSIGLHRATILWGVPSFVRRVLLRAIETGADFRSVRMCAITGEASSPAMREELRRCLRELGAQGTIVFDRYGSTELGAFAQCAEEGGWHNPAPEIQYHEVVDPDTGRRLPDGERGALAVTHLDRRGTVLIRFVLGDIVSIERGPCPVCGRHGDRIIGPVVRNQDLVKIKGMLINPDVLLETLQGLAQIDEFQVVVQRADRDDPFSMDELVVRLASRDGDHEGLGKHITDLVQQAVRVRPRIEFAASREIYDPANQTKARRFVDKR